MSIENIKNRIEKINNLATNANILFGESFSKNKFQMKAKMDKKRLSFFIERNPLSYKYLLSSLFYQEENACLFKNLFNFYQDLIINNPNYPFSCRTSLIDFKFLKIIEAKGLIKIINKEYTNRETIIYFNKLRSFEEKDLIFFAYLLEKYKINIKQFKFYKSGKLYVRLKLKNKLEETKHLKSHLETKKEELKEIKKVYKEYLLNEEKIIAPTLK